MNRRGYQGHVLLIGPDGTQQIVRLPGRVPRGHRPPLLTAEEQAQRSRAVRRFHRLLSAGWTVATAIPDTETNVDPAGQVQITPTEEKDKEEVSEVAASTTQTSPEVHGGQRASREIPDSPNSHLDGTSHQSEQDAPDKGEHTQLPKPARRQRGRRERKNKPSPSTQPGPLRQGSGISGGAAVYCRTPITPSATTQAAAAASARLLADLVGTRSDRTTVYGTAVDAHRLLLALETGDDPLPALEIPREVPKKRIRITPDCSGSTQDWSGLGQAWALALAAHDTLDVVYVENVNGAPVVHGQQIDAERLLRDVDLLIYLGDHDGDQLCREYAASGSSVIVLDSHRASWAAPRVRERALLGRGHRVWVDQVSAKHPSTWTRALRLALPTRT